MAALGIQNLTVTASTWPPSPGQAITISFQIQPNTWNNYDLLVGLNTQDPTAGNECTADILAANSGIYSRSSSSTTWFYGTVTKTATGRTYTDNDVIPGEAILLDHDGGSPVWHNVQIVTYVPPEKTGSLYVFATVANEGMLYYKCNRDSGNDTHNGTMASVALPVSGASECFKFDLKVARWTNSSNEIYFVYKLVNWGESGLDMSKLKFRYWMYDANTDWMIGYTAMNRRQKADGTDLDWAGLVGTDGFTYTGTTLDCASDRKANMYYQRQFVSSFFIPGGGGNAGNYTDNVVSLFRPSHPDISAGWADDFSRTSDMTPESSGSPVLSSAITTDDMYIAAYYDGERICEYINATTVDPNSGTEPCETPCAGTNVYCVVGTPTNTPTPSLSIVKSIVGNPSTVMLGDTVTFCLAYTNNSSYTMSSFNIWDSVPAVTDYINCNSSCSTAASNTIVYWTIASLIPTGTATVCFWVKVARYPYLLEHFNNFAVFLNEGDTGTDEAQCRNTGQAFVYYQNVLAKDLIN